MLTIHTNNSLTHMQRTAKPWRLPPEHLRIAVNGLRNRSKEGTKTHELLTRIAQNLGA